MDDKTVDEAPLTPLEILILAILGDDILTTTDILMGIVNAQNYPYGKFDATIDRLKRDGLIECEIESRPVKGDKYKFFPAVVNIVWRKI